MVLPEACNNLLILFKKWDFDLKYIYSTECQNDGYAWLELKMRSAFKHIRMVSEVKNDLERGEGGVLGH